MHWLAVGGCHLVRLDPIGLHALSKRVAENVKCSLIIMASGRPENQDHLLGPNGGGDAKCSVLIVRD